MSTNGDLQPLHLHAFATSPNPLKIAIALEFLGLPYTIQIWDFGDDPVIGVKSAAFAKLSENGRVPVLEDKNTGVVAWESGAVMNYLRRVYDKEDKVLGLGGRGEVGEQERVDFDKWEELLKTTVGPMTGQMVWFKYYHQPKNDDAFNRYEKQVYRSYDVLEGQLKKTEGKSILPGGMTAVDLHYYPWLRQTEFMGVSLDAYPYIQSWLRNMGAFKEVNAAYDRLQEAAKLAGTANADETGKILGGDKGLLREVAAGKM